MASYNMSFQDVSSGGSGWIDLKIDSEFGLDTDNAAIAAAQGIIDMLGAANVTNVSLSKPVTTSVALTI